MDSNMKVTPKVSRLSTNEDTENDPLVYALYMQLQLNYLERMIDLSRIKMHEDLEFVHFFEIYILKENDLYRVITGRSHIHEVFLGKKHYGDAFIVDKNKENINPRMNISVYEKIEMNKTYKIFDIPKIVFDFNKLFKDVENEELALEIIKF